jgi:hypothetical protein
MPVIGVSWVRIPEIICFASSVMHSQLIRDYIITEEKALDTNLQEGRDVYYVIPNKWAIKVIT